MKRFPMILSLAFGLLVWFGLPSATQASDRFFVGLNFGAPQPRVERVWVPETYVTRTERVLVEPEHYVDRWVPPVYETRYDKHHRPVTVMVRGGCCEKVLIPARYEVREVRQLVPGYWREVAAPCRPAFLPFFGARFGPDRDGRHDVCHDDRRDDYRGNYRGWFSRH